MLYDYQFSDGPFAAWVVLGQTWAAMYKAGERKLAKAGLTPEKLAVLWVCRDSPGPMTPAEISRRLFRESQTIAGLLSRMEKEGLVRRVPKRKGRPFTEVQITAKGEELCSRGIKAGMPLIAKIMSSLSAEELEQLQKLVRKLRENVVEELHIELLQPPSYARR